MNIARVFFGGLITSVVIAACGNTGTGTGTSSERSGSGASALAGCVTGSTNTEQCQACFQSKCEAEVQKCYGRDYSGGACKALITCSKDSDDPCNAPCLMDSECSSCITDDLQPCLRAKCPDDCAAVIEKGTCADLTACCEIVSDPHAKTGCVGIANEGNETICHSYYASLKSFCE